MVVFFFQAEDGIRDYKVTGVQTCALPILLLSQLIERAEELIENGDRDIRGLGGGPLRESDHVGEKHADVIEPIGDRVLLAFEPLGNLRWKYVEQQPLGSLHGLITLDPEVGQDE